MKKLILVTLLAVAASWLLTERQPGDEKGPLLAALDDFQARHGDRAPRVNVHQEVPAPQLLVPPAPPSPPDSIRTVPWKPAKKDRPKAPNRRPDVIPPFGPTAQSKAPPAWFPKSEAEEEALAKPDSAGSRVLLGRLSASDDRARRDLAEILEREVASWLAADIPPSAWKVPRSVIDAMVMGSYTQEVTKDLIVPGAREDVVKDPAPAGSVHEFEASALAPSPEVDGLYTLYRAGRKLDFSATRRAHIVGMYRRDVAAARMHRLGGGLALALVGLAVLSGYIRADEATRGYYTNRLRLAAAAGLGAAGVAAYRFLA